MTALHQHFIIMQLFFIQKIKNAVSMNCGNIKCSAIVDVTQWFPPRAMDTQENTWKDFDLALLNL